MTAPSSRDPEADRLRDLVAFLRAVAPSVPVGEALRQWDEQQIQIGANGNGR